MNRIKKIFHKLPDSFQLIIYKVYDRVFEKINYFRYHRPLEGKVRRFLRKNGISKIRRIRHGWRIEPIFSQYYRGFYKESEIFCKVYRLPDYGCIEREKRTLSYIASTGDKRLVNAVPAVVASYQTDDMRILITEYVEGKSLKKSGLQSLELYGECRKILDGLSDNGIMHIDIRPENFIVAKDKTVTLIDFGMAYVEKHEQEDELYQRRIFPAALWGTGCGCYNPMDGVYDDAYAMLRTLKDVDPRFLRTCKEGWTELNQLIGSRQMVVERE